jgi:hypothetical protein
MPHEEIVEAQVFHFCFPLRDIFTMDYSACRGDQDLEDQFVAYYSELFCLPLMPSIWRTEPDGPIRHPAAGGRVGWHDAYLKERIECQDLYRRARDVRRILDTEADAMILTKNHGVLVECKYRTEPSLEQHERHVLMNRVLGSRLQKDLRMCLVVENDRDPRFAKVALPYILWRDIEQWLSSSDSKKVEAR